MATKLVGLELDEVSFVDEGANFDKETGDGAHVLLWKRREGDAMEVNETFWEKLTAVFKGALADEALTIQPPAPEEEEEVTVNEEVTKRLEESEAAQVELEKRLADAEAEKAEFAKRLEEMEAEKAEAVQKAAE